MNSSPGIQSRTPSTRPVNMLNAWKTLNLLRTGGEPEQDAKTYSVEDIVNALDAVTSFADEPPASPTQAVEFSRLLMGQYRARDFVDVKIFVSSLASVFQHYPRNLCRLAVDPMVGVPSEVKFPPSVQEVKAWLDRERDRLGYYLWRVTKIREAQIGPRQVRATETGSAMLNGHPATATFGRGAAGFGTLGATAAAAMRTAAAEMEAART